MIPLLCFEAPFNESAHTDPAGAQRSCRRTLRARDDLYAGFCFQTPPLPRHQQHTSSAIQLDRRSKRADRQLRNAHALPAEPCVFSGKTAS
jgi:hypothetical protein